MVVTVAYCERDLEGHSHAWDCTAQIPHLDYQPFNKTANAVWIVSTHKPVDEGFLGPQRLPYIATCTRRARASK